jgi:hypothetical protein
VRSVEETGGLDSSTRNRSTAWERRRMARLWSAPWRAMARCCQPLVDRASRGFLESLGLSPLGGRVRLRREPWTPSSYLSWPAQLDCLPPNKSQDFGIAETRRDTAHCRCCRLRGRAAYPSALSQLLSFLLRPLQFLERGTAAEQFPPQFSLRGAFKLFFQLPYPHLTYPRRRASSRPEHFS